MDKKFQARRRWVGRQRGHRRAAVLAVCVAVLAAGALFLWLRSSDVFAVRYVTANVLQHVTSAEISEATADARGVSLLRLSTGPIEKRLAALPYVRTAEIHRRFPNTLDVRLVEYEPVAQVQAGDGHSWLVADDGRALQETSSPGLPLVIPAARVIPVAGEQLPDMVTSALPVALLLQQQQIGGSLPPVDHIAVSGGGQIVVVLKDGTELRLGDPTELKYKLMVVATIVEQYLRDGHQLNYVDATVPDRVAVNGK